MAEATQSSDLQVGVSLLFGFVAVLLAVVTMVAAYLNAVQHVALFQLLSGVGLAGIIIAGGLAIAAIHLYE